jgi:hypothetical protein
LPFCFKLLKDRVSPRHEERTKTPVDVTRNPIGAETIQRPARNPEKTCPTALSPISVRLFTRETAIVEYTGLTARCQAFSRIAAKKTGIKGANPET